MSKIFLEKFTFYGLDIDLEPEPELDFGNGYLVYSPPVLQGAVLVQELNTGATLNKHKNKNKEEEN